MPIDWLLERASDLRYRLRALARRGTVERELDDELAFHLAMEAEKLERAGLSPDEARRRARLAFGGVDRAKEASRDGRGVRPLETLAQDLRYAARALRRAPGFTLAVSLTLALGIGANVAMFGVVDRLLFRAPAFLPDADRVHRVYLAAGERGTGRLGATTEYRRYRDLREWTTAFSTVAAFRVRPIAVGDGEEAGELPVAVVSASYFDLFDARPRLGRFFDASEDRPPAGAPVVVLSDATWRARFGARPDVVGRTLRVGPLLCTIVGVAPPGFAGVVDDQPPALFVPVTTFGGAIAARPGWADTYEWGWLSVLVRRKPGVSVAAASADLSSAYRRSWEAERALGGELPSLAAARPRALAAPVAVDRGPNARQAAKVAGWLGGVALLVLLIACANVANLVLARALGRRRELALRLALGGGRVRVALPQVLECLLLALLGGVAGVLLAQLGSAALGRLFLPDDPGAGPLRDPRALLFAAAASVVAALLIGLVPALQAERRSLGDALKAAGARATGSLEARRGRTRAALLVAQAALTTVLLVGAGLFVNSLRHVRAVPLGYEPSRVLAVYANMRGVRMDDSAFFALQRRLEDAARALPGVESASLAASVPLMDEWTAGFSVPGVDSVRRIGRFTFQAGTRDLFRTLGTRVVRGRAFTDADRAGAPGVAVVSEGAARALWPGRDALGQCIRYGADTAPCTTVVGVVEDIAQSSLRDEPRLQVYLPALQHPASLHLLVVRTRGDAAAQGESVRRALQRAMPGASYLTAHPLARAVEGETAAWRLGASLFVAFGGLAVLVAAVGLYGVVSYSVAQRTRDLGIRVALGARPRDVARLVVGGGVGLAAAGAAIGLGAALVAGRPLAPLLFDVRPADPLSLGGAALVVLLVALLATLVPARRAARVDPGITLRAD